MPTRGPPQKQGYLAPARRDVRWSSDPQLNLIKDRLCDVCAHIDFDSYLGKHMTPRRLGSWKDILRQKSCPFCRLVVCCMQTGHHTSIPVDARDRIVLCNRRSWELGVEVLEWDANRSQQYSNRVDLKTKSKEGDLGDRYRFLVGCDSDHKDEYGCIQYLSEKEPSRQDRAFFGRTIQQSNVDPQLLVSWLRRCRKWHDTCEKDDLLSSNLPDNFRVIDLRRRCIVRAPPRCQYVALSYVWGEQAMRARSGMKMPLLLKENVQYSASGVEYTPLPREDTLPQTLKDAIEVTTLLGFNFLWIDALTIIQNLPFELKYNHLHNMDAVYSCATLTIAAGSGTDADYGLPGISRPRKYTQYSQKVHGLYLATMFPSFSEVENSGRLLNWNTRGWTLQEKLLSKRLLLFTDYQVYFKCAESIWTEEINMETGRLPESVEVRPSKYRWVAYRKAYEVHGLDRLAGHLGIRDTRDKDKDLGYLPNYVQLVENYSSRSLSDPKDYLFAIDGVLKTFAHTWFSGLPQKFFHEGLLWRCNSVPDPQTLATNIPSWSPFFYLARKFWDDSTLRDTSTERKYSSTQNLIIDSTIHLFTQPTKSIFYCTNGRMKAVHPGSDDDSRWQPIPKSKFGARAVDGIHHTPTLSMETTVVRLKIGASLCDKKCKKRMHWYALNDWKGSCCGEIFVPKEVADRKGNHRQDFITLSWGQAFQKVDTIAMEYVPKTRNVDKGPNGEEKVRETKQAQSLWLVANVFLVTTLVDGVVSRRIGVGKVIATAWIEARPERVSILLG